MSLYLNFTTLHQNIVISSIPVYAHGLCIPTLTSFFYLYLLYYSVSQSQIYYTLHSFFYVSLYLSVYYIVVSLYQSIVLLYLLLDRYTRLQYDRYTNNNHYFMFVNDYHGRMFIYDRIHSLWDLYSVVRGIFRQCFYRGGGIG